MMELTLHKISQGAEEQWAQDEMRNYSLQENKSPCQSLPRPCLLDPLPLLTEKNFRSRQSSIVFGGTEKENKEDKKENTGPRR